MSVSQKCFAYKILKKQIGQQCKIYRDLHSTRKMGLLPGMYTQDEEGRYVPSESTSSFLRGGLINTMACFEVYLTDLLDEAIDTILYERNSDCSACENCMQLKYEHVVLRDQKREGVDHKIQEAKNSITHLNILPTLKHIAANYADKLCLGKDNDTQQQLQSRFINELFNVGPLSDDAEPKPMIYYYLIDESYKISKVDFEDEDLLNMMLNFCYGTRCVMAHGNASKTLDSGVLKNFPSCKNQCDDCSKSSQCKQQPPCTETIKKLRKIGTLSKHIDTCITEQGRKRVLKISRYFPWPKTLRKLRKETDRNEAIEIVKKFFPDVYHNKLDKFEQEILDENYAIFHMCRIHSYLKENERLINVTYQVLVRINQFILVLAHRMRIAVGRILIYKYGLPDGIWGVPRDKDAQIAKIDKFEKGHQELVLDLGNFHNNNPIQNTAPAEKQHSALKGSSLQPINITACHAKHWPSNSCQIMVINPDTYTSNKQSKGSSQPINIICRTEHWVSNTCQAVLVMLFAIVIAILINLYYAS